MLLQNLNFRFHLFKENKDTQEALNIIAKMLGVQVGDMQFLRKNFFQLKKQNSLAHVSSFSNGDMGLNKKYLKRKTSSDVCIAVRCVLQHTSSSALLTAWYRKAIRLQGYDCFYGWSGSLGPLDLLVLKTSVLYQPRGYVFLSAFTLDLHFGVKTKKIVIMVNNFTSYVSV